MSDATINLLPGENALKQKRQEKFTRFQFFSTVAVLALLLVASCAAALRIFQSQNIKQAGEGAKLAEERVVSFREKETALTFLKNRLNIIGKIFNTPSKQTATYQLVNSLVPVSVGIASISVSRSEQLSVAVLIPDTLALGELLENFSNDKAFESIAKVEIESLSRSIDGTYRSNLKVMPK